MTSESDPLFRHQPRWAEVTAAVALLAMLPVCAVVAWMGVRELRSPTGNWRSAAIQLFVVPLAAYCLVLARRLLRGGHGPGGRPRRLVSPIALFVMGGWLLAGTFVMWLWAPVGWREPFTGLLLGIACFQLG